jgi:hypothetical protein
MGQNPLELFAQHRRAERLFEEGGVAVFDLSNFGELFAVAAEENGGLGRPKAAHIVESLNPILPGHRDVEEAGTEGVGAPFKDQRGRFPVVGYDDIESDLLEHARGDGPHAGLVVRYENRA